ncbi:hypothetical protein DH2020_045746 [Rehmannia glutinosa]|uniref:Uncharacterized protein n=1 Tax=Rehmannia glutinosa TaxID=99300 RepID=A0ABR0UD79_REHGL
MSQELSHVEIFDTAIRCLQSYQTAQKISNWASTNTPAENIQNWIKPPRGKCKINSDSSVISPAFFPGQTTSTDISYASNA